MEPSSVPPGSQTCFIFVSVWSFSLAGLVFTGPRSHAARFVYLSGSSVTALVSAGAALPSRTPRNFSLSLIPRVILSLWEVVVVVVVFIMNGLS